MQINHGFVCHVQKLFSFLTAISSDKKFSYDDDLNSTNTYLVLNLPENVTNVFNQFNDFSSDQKQNSDNIRNCKYYNIDEI